MRLYRRTACQAMIIFLHVIGRITGNGEDARLARTLMMHDARRPLMSPRNSLPLGAGLVKLCKFECYLSESTGLDYLLCRTRMSAIIGLRTRLEHMASCGDV
ncbi:hypothetical protein BGW36DRAFT_196854 [Talaromyces proteolyticus]|uniref:Uncharacterized protein n=1 Tax=Talaromyces proteolyticus TaxID=1131652 RepID=A0AAD4KRR0_9EURO|nr:uncharacterized protein BGW36DRAFT_196854 [Talaromyces proteolyticus]KAH8695072.1 hypothetical protein BGW36DRAFT_196854 [Talaromyces proteolyticus]